MLRTFVDNYNLVRATYPIRLITLDIGSKNATIMSCTLFMLLLYLVQVIETLVHMKYTYRLLN